MAVDISTFQILTDEVELETRPELLSVAVIDFPSTNLAYAFVSADDTQVVVVTDSSSISLDWSRWVNEVLSGSAVNATYTLHRTQLDEYRNTLRPSEVVGLSPQGRIIVELNVERNNFYILVSPRVAC